MKGVLEGCVLGIISKGETYGYDILQELSQHGFGDVGEGTLYPVLTRLDKNGYITCRKEKSPLGPIRKYYRISPSGEKYFEDFRANYKKITESAYSILF